MSFNEVDSAKVPDFSTREMGSEGGADRRTWRLESGLTRAVQTLSPGSDITENCNRFMRELRLDDNLGEGAVSVLRPRGCTRVRNASEVRSGISHHAARRSTGNAARGAVGYRMADAAPWPELED